MGTPLSSHIAGVLAPEKFQTVDAKYGYRVLHQPVSPCPNDADGCPTCNVRGAVPGKHARPIAEVDFDDTVMLRDDGLPLRLNHRELTAPLRISWSGGELAEGVDFVRTGRQVAVLAPLPRRTLLRVQYRAYAESWVHMQHAYADFAGAGRKAEFSLNLRYANLEQGVIAMSIPANALGYHCKPGDRYIGVDTSVISTVNIDADRQNLRTKHRFVRGITEAFGIDKHGIEVPLNASYNPEKLTFSINPEAEFERGVITCHACPIYTVYLDNGEFRHPAGLDHHRLVLLMREEISR